MSNRPLDSNEGAKETQFDNALLMVEMPEEVGKEWEWIVLDAVDASGQPADGIGYREFLVPAETVNRHPIQVLELTDQEES